MDRKQAAGQDERLPDKVRRLSLDLEDLHFENDRLKSDLLQAQAEILALTDRNLMLQRRFERLVRLAPRGSPRVVRWLVQWFRRP